MQISADMIVKNVRGHVRFYADYKFEAGVYVDLN